MERTGTVGGSVSFVSPGGAWLYTCDGTGVRADGASQPWCGESVGRLVHGRLRDPRLDILCRDRKRRIVAFAWVSPRRPVRWIALDQGSYTELYEVGGGLPVRVSSRRFVDSGRSRARFEVTQYDRAGHELVRSTLEARVAG